MMCYINQNLKKFKKQLQIAEIIECQRLSQQNTRMISLALLDLSFKVT